VHDSPELYQEKLRQAASAFEEAARLGEEYPGPGFLDELGWGRDSGQPKRSYDEWLEHMLERFEAFSEVGVAQLGPPEEDEEEAAEIEMRSWELWTMTCQALRFWHISEFETVVLSLLDDPDQAEPRTYGSLYIFLDVWGH